MGDGLTILPTATIKDARRPSKRSRSSSEAAHVRKLREGRIHISLCASVSRYAL